MLFSKRISQENIPWIFLSVLGVKYFYIFSWEVNHENRSKFSIFFFQNLVLLKKSHIDLYFLLWTFHRNSDQLLADIYSVLNLIGSKDVVEKSTTEKNFIYKNPRTLRVNFPDYDWKHFLNIKFLACNGIRGWRTIMITSHSTCLFVTFETED